MEAGGSPLQTDFPLRALFRLSNFMWILNNVSRFINIKHNTLFEHVSVDLYIGTFYEGPNHDFNWDSRLSLH